VSVDLAAEAAAAGMTLGADFKIKFQQFDNFPLTTDGRGYDQIEVRIPVDPGDLYAFELVAGESATLALKARDPGQVALQLLDSSGAVVAGGDPAAPGLVNGSFETGDFAGWSTATLGSPFIPWTVSGAGAGAGFGMAPTAPQEGAFVAWNGFDGAGPMSFALTQDVAVPNEPALATLSWRERIQWNFGIGGFATLPRTYHVEVYDPATNTLIATLFTFSTGTQATNPTGDTGWQVHAADLSAHAGSTVRLRFREEIPQSFTGPAQLEIDDVRFGPPSPALPTNVDELIDGFVAEQSDVYFARVRGDAGTPYTLLVLRNAQFDLEPNDDLDKAHPIEAPHVAGRHWILGHASGETLYGASRNGELFTIDPATGAGTLVGVIPGPSTEIEVNADDRAFSQFSDGAFTGQEFDIDTGAGIGVPIFNGAAFNGLEWIGGTLFGTAIEGPGFPSTLRILDPFSGGSVSVGATGVGPISGLAYDASSDVLYGIAGGPGPATLFTLDRATGEATPIGATGFQAGSLEFGPGGLLYGGGTGVNGGELHVIDPATGSSTLVGPTGFSRVTGLALRGGKGDSYSVDLLANEQLAVRTYTPAAKGGEFVNVFDPMLRLYDAAGNLLAEDDDSASDRRNARLRFNVDASGAGTYFVEVTSSLKNDEPSGGEYLLTVKSREDP
jgi:hypothetical protein